MPPYNKYNFFKHTYCIFTEVATTDILAAEQHNYQSKSGSEYYYTNQGVYRTSNHWGRVANCRWRLVTKSNKGYGKKTGFAKWEDFYENDETKKLFFITVDVLAEKIEFHHKSESQVENIQYYTASEAIKCIRKIEGILQRKAYYTHEQILAKIEQIAVVKHIVA